jgi:hypothetical protein
METHNQDPTWAFWIIAILSVPLPIWLMFYKKIRHTKEGEQQNKVNNKQKVSTLSVSTLTYRLSYCL